MTIQFNTDNNITGERKFKSSDRGYSIERTQQV